MTNIYLSPGKMYRVTTDRCTTHLVFYLIPYGKPLPKHRQRRTFPVISNLVYLRCFFDYCNGTKELLFLLPSGEQGFMFSVTAKDNFTCVSEG
jgi:hypothetical protein